MTFFFMSLLVGSLAAQLLLWAFFLRLGLRWAKVPGVTTRRVIVATLLSYLIQVAITATMFEIPSTQVRAGILPTVAVFGAIILAQIFVISKVCRTNSMSAVLAWLTTLLSPALMVLLVLLIVRPFLFEAFRCRRNSMAPTLLGDHWQGNCAECGEAAFCSPLPDWAAPREPVVMICRKHFHMTRVSDYSEEVGESDRLSVAKFLEPRRWDMIVFRYSADPSQNFVMRLVGLPGEVIEIREGHVWADGTKLRPPESLREIEYLSAMEESPDELWGSPKRPARLAGDEYFVLGDFSVAANDSRLWGTGGSADSEPHLYAVPESNLIGVVTHIYWPPERWRAFR